MLTGLTSVFGSLLIGLWDFLKYVIYGLLIIIGIILIMISINTLYYCFVKKMDFKKRTTKLPKPHYSKPKSILHRLFVEFPRRFVLDQLNHNPDDFGFYGIHIFAGEQGSGKTVAMVHKILQLREKYPCCKVAANFTLDFQDNKIEDWTDILENNNGTKGQIIVLDEIQNWFNSLESKDIPIEFISEICQQRKQRKAVIGTSQVFTRIGKPIREQCTFLYKPLTIFNCITVVRVYKPKIKDDGTLDEKNMKMRKCYFFVHDEYLRECYDTYEKVERLSKKGFKPLSEQINNHNEISNDFLNNKE